MPCRTTCGINRVLYQLNYTSLWEVILNASILLDHKVGATKQNVILILNSVFSPLTGALR